MNFDGTNSSVVLRGLSDLSDQLTAICFPKEDPKTPIKSPTSTYSKIIDVTTAVTYHGDVTIVTGMYYHLNLIITQIIPFHFGMYYNLNLTISRIIPFHNYHIISPQVCSIA